MLNSFLEEYQYHVIVEAIEEKHSFWNCIEDMAYIKSVEFDLVSPNILGANFSVTDLLKSIKYKYNASRYVTKMINEDESININPDDPRLKGAAQYAESGGGNWTIKGRLKNSKKMRKIQSQNMSRKIMIEDMTSLDSVWKEIEDMNKDLDSQKDDEC